MDLCDFKLNHESLLPYVNKKKVLENSNDNNIEELCRENNIKFTIDKKCTITKLGNELCRKINELDIKLTLREIFNFDEDLIDDLCYMSGLIIEHKRTKKAIASIYLSNKLVKADCRYTMSPCFIINMASIENFDDAISIFNMRVVSVNEELINMSGRSSRNTFLSPIGVTNEIFKPEIVDVCLYLTKEIKNLCSNSGYVNMSHGEIKGLYKDIESKGSLDYIYNLYNFIKRISSKIKDTKVTNIQFSDLILSLQPIIPNNKTIHDPYKRILCFSKLNWPVLERFIDILSMKVFISPYYMFVKYSCLIWEKINDETNMFIDYVISLLSLLDENMILDLSIVFSKFIEISQKHNNINFFSYLTPEFIKEICIICKYVYIDVDFIAYYFTVPFRSEIMEMIYILFLIKGVKIQGNIVVDCLNFFMSIRTNDVVSLTSRNDKLYYEGSHIGSYYVNSKDNNLFVRIARMILLRDMFSGIKEFDLLSESCDNSVLLNIPYRKIKLSKIREFYNQTVDVHSSQRDENTRVIYEKFLGLNSYGEFINNDPNSMGEQLNIVEEEVDIWKVLDRERKNDVKVTTNETEEYEGSISKSEIETLFNDFWDKCKVAIGDNNIEMEKFSRVMGVDFDMKPVVKRTDDFPGFFIDQTRIRNTYIKQRLILANLWKFACNNPKEKLCEAMVNCYKQMIQPKKHIIDGKIQIKDYAVCNDGKLQYFAMAILQGRIRNDIGETMMIDVIKVNTDIISDDNKEIEPSDMYHMIKPFMDGISEGDNIPKNADEMYRLFFHYIKDNNMESQIRFALEILCLYSEGKDGLRIEPKFSLPELFEGNFQIEDYELIKNHVDGVLEADRLRNEALDNNELLMQFLDDENDDDILFDDDL